MRAKGNHNCNKGPRSFCGVKVTSEGFSMFRASGCSGNGERTYIFSAKVLVKARSPNPASYSKSPKPIEPKPTTAKKPAPTKARNPLGTPIRALPAGPRNLCQQASAEEGRKSDLRICSMCRGLGFAAWQGGFAEHSRSSLYRWHNIPIPPQRLVRTMKAPVHH